MSFLFVDPDKCKRDGICVSDCPAQIIELKNKSSVPDLISGGEELCINCGHCVAVCPTGAMSLRTMPSEKCPGLDKSLLPNNAQMDHFLRSRRSIRVYRDKPVEKKILESLIDVARYAPSGHNLQPVSWIVISERSEMKRLAAIVIDWMRCMLQTNPAVAQSMHFDRPIAAWENGVDRILRGAPHLIIAHGPSDLPASVPACIIALTYLELATHSSGLGACWAGYFNSAATYYKPMQDALSLPPGQQCFGAMMIGYAKNEYHRLPLRNDPTIEWR